MLGYDYPENVGLPCCGHRAVQHDKDLQRHCRCCRRGELRPDGQPPAPERSRASECVASIYHWLCSLWTGHRWPAHCHGQMTCSRCGYEVKARSA